MKKRKVFSLIWHYLKDQKLKLILYIILVILTFLPTIFIPYIWGHATEYLLSGNFEKFVQCLIIWEGIYILLYTVVQLIRDKIYNFLEITFQKRVSKDLYTKVMNLPAIAFEEIGVGEFINRIYHDPDRVIELLARLIKMICKLMVAIIVFFILFKTSIIIGLEILIFALIMGYISYKYLPKIRKVQENIKDNTDKFLKSSTENITGIREIKGLGIKQIINNRTFKELDNISVQLAKQKDYDATYYSLNNFIYYILQFIILLSTGYLLTQGRITYAIFVMIESYLWRLDDVVESISDFGSNYNKVLVSLKRIDEIVNNRLYKDEKFGTKNLDNIKGTVELKNVYFKYREDEDNTLDGLSMILKPNIKNAIIGRSGNGKTTIFNLLLRYFDTTKGEILIDGVNIKELTEQSLRNNISIIRQNPFLFNMSIFENFKIVKQDVTIEEVKRVCKMSYIDEYIESLPKKYDTIIGEGGVNLSGGQKQRLKIAIALLLDTKIILFDEATSALDNESQEYIKKTIDNLVKDHTVIIVAHRLSTIIDSDVIHIIDKGKLGGIGTHDELIKTNQIYKKLYETENK
ncbi:MAG: ABC transporter ATP-binding protein [Bacilli bacterium]|nr:ABC transporter ATP-binding protein [Bacilli bacterium]